MALPIEDYLSGTFFGNTLLQYLIFFALVAGAILIGKIVYYFFKTIVKVLTKKTKSAIDDIFIEVIEKPLIFVIIIIGFFIGYKQLSLPAEIEPIFAMITKNLITIAIAWFGISLLDKIIEHYLVPMVSKTHTDLDDHLVPLIRKLVKYVLVVIALLIVLSNIGINVTSALAGLGLGGLAVALAAQETLKNILGGVAILTDKPFKLGDWVEIDKYQGSVVEIGLRSTRLKTITGEFVTVPNSIIASTSAVNYLRFPNRNINFVIGLTYDTSAEKIDKAKSVISKIIISNEKYVKDSIEINFTAFNSYSLDIDIRFQVKTNKGPEMRAIRDNINMKIKKEFQKENINIAFPTQTIELKR